MVRGSRRGVPARLIAATLPVAMLLASCANIPAAAPTVPPTTSATTAPATPTTMPPATTTTTTTPPTTMGTTATTTTQPSATSTVPDIGLEILVPEGAGPFPTAVLVHGGGWVAGSPELMRDLARFLTSQGILTVNAPYTLSGDVPGFPIAVDDVACAVRYAAAHPDGDGSVTVIGHSAGAHLSALVALDDGVYGKDCPLGEPVIPDRLVGLAGPYEVTRLGPLMLPFFGAGPADDPAAWAAGNPLLQVGKNTGLSTLLLHGEEDGFVDSTFATDFADALAGAGSDVLVEVVEGASHNDMTDPAFVGDLIATWLERSD